MISRIVHFQHQGICPGNGFIKIFGDFDAHAFEDFLTFVQTFLALERRFETQAGDHFQRGIVSAFLTDFRESDGVAGVQTDQRDFDFIAHFFLLCLFEFIGLVTSILQVNITRFAEVASAFSLKIQFSFHLLRIHTRRRSL